VRLLALISAGAVFVATVLVALVVQLPASLWGGLGNANNFFTPLAGSTLTVGAGITHGSASKIIRWHWCPAQGLASLCFSVAGHGAYVNGLLRPGFSGIAVTNVSFKGLKSAEFGLTDSALRATLGGTIDRALLPWDACFYNGLTTVEGKLELTDVEIMAIAIADLRLAVSAAGERGLRLTGNDIDGNFILDGNLLRGTLRVTNSKTLMPVSLSMLLANAQGVLNLDVAHRLACR